MIRLIVDLAGDWRRLDERVESLSREIDGLARQDAGCERLMSVPGSGRSSRARWWLRSAPGTRSTRAATSPLGGPCPEADLDGGSHDRQDIQVRQSLPRRAVRSG